MKSYQSAVSDNQSSLQRWEEILACKEESEPDSPLLPKLQKNVAALRAKVAHLQAIGEAGYQQEQQALQEKMRESNTAFLRDLAASRYAEGSPEERWVLEMAEEQEKGA